MWKRSVINSVQIKPGNRPVCLKGCALRLGSLSIYKSVTIVRMRSSKCSSLVVCDLEELIIVVLDRMEMTTRRQASIRQITRERLRSMN